MSLPPERRPLSERCAPILIFYKDNSRKISGIGTSLTSTGSIQNDIQVVKDCYASFKCKNTDQFLASSKDSIKNCIADETYADQVE
jgi:hypothetical protein